MIRFVKNDKLNQLVIYIITNISKYIIDYHTSLQVCT